MKALRLRDIRSGQFIPLRLPDSSSTVSEKDYDYLKSFVWLRVLRSGIFYAVLKDKPYLYMHRFVMRRIIGGNFKGVVHHIDYNGLNNCRENLVLMAKERHKRLHGWR